LHEGVPVTRAAAAAEVPLRTARRWLSAYRARVLAGLAPAPRSDRALLRFPADLVTMIEGLYLQRPAPSVATVHHTAAAVATAQGWPVPSYTTVREIVRGVEVSLVTLAHQGTKAYQLAYDLVYRRESAAPNGMWQSDHTELDLLVLGPAGAPARPWLTVILDDHSRAVPGYG
jgi:putative transposase